MASDHNVEQIDSLMFLSGFYSAFVTFQILPEYKVNELLCRPNLQRYTNPHEETTAETAVSMYKLQLSQIFKKNLSRNNIQFILKLKQNINTIYNIRYNRKVLPKEYGRLNHLLNIVITNVDDTISDDPQITRERQMLKNIRMYKHNGELKEAVEVQEKKSHQPVIVERINYDGDKTVCLSQFYLKVSKKFDFSFTDIQQATDCLNAAIEKSSIVDIIINTDPSKLSILSPKYHIYSSVIFFTLKLHIVHSEGEGIIESNDSRIAHLLSQGGPTKKSPCTSNFYVSQYIVRINIKIRQIIETQKNNTSFPYGVVKCYRNGCYSDIFFIKNNDNSIKCHMCNIADICPKCESTSHPGLSCNSSSDDSVKAYLESRSDVVVCPGCTNGIERVEGCNHMTCTICQTNFCFICQLIFPDHDQISFHFRNADSFNECNGNPQTTTDT